MFVLAVEPIVKQPVKPGVLQPVKALARADAPAAEVLVPIVALHVLVVLVAVLVLGPVLDATGAATNAPHHVSNLVLVVLVAVPAVHLAAQVVNLLAVILVLELVLMAVLIHAEHAVLLVLQIVPQTAEPLAKAHVMEA